MQTGLSQIRTLRRTDKRITRLIWTGFIVVYLASLFFLMCYKGRGYGFVDPLQALQNIYTFFRIQISRIFSLPAWTNRAEIIAAHPEYAGVVERFRTGILLTCGGGILALSGLVYQSATRNPMAVPTMLGVSSGVNLAQVLLVLNFGDSVYELSKFHYIYCYGISAISLLLVLGLGKLAGGKNAGVSDMLIVGTVVNRVLQLLVNYYRSQMDTDELTILQDFSEDSYELFNSFASLGILVGISFIVILPLYMLRFRYNAISFEDSDAITMGVRPNFLRTYGMIAGALLTTTAMMFCGNVGMVAMLVPHLCRYLFGAEFSKLFWSSALIGGLLMLLSRIVSMLVYMEDFEIPIGSIISLLALPILVWVMLQQRRGWE